jgi:putative peptidoglycan lipid II flippase
VESEVKEGIGSGGPPLPPSASTVNPEQAPEGFLRSAGIVSLMTLFSRILGMLESRVLAHYLGAGLAADAFFVAFRLPNLLRRFTAEGVMVAAFLPTIHEVEAKEGQDIARGFIARFVGSLASLLALVSLLGTLGMGFIIGLMMLGKADAGASLAHKLGTVVRAAIGLQPAPPEWALTTLLGRIMFSYVLLVSVSAALGGVLNLRGRFALPAATPIFWNLVVIVVGVGLTVQLGWQSPERSAIAFAIAVLFGGVVQAAMLWPAYRRLGLGIAPGLHLRDANVRRALSRMVPGLFGAGVYQINVLISTMLASSLPNGSQTVLFNSNMMGELVLGLFAVSLATVSLPLLSRQAEAKDWDGLRASVSLGLRSAGLAAIPASVGMALLSQPIIALLFQTGKFDAADVAWTAHTLSYQATGLLFIAGTRVLVPACYALKDYRTPVKIGVVSLVANVTFSVLLMRLLGTAGISLANGLSSLIGLTLLCVILARRRVLPTREVLVAWARMALAAVPMGLVAWYGYRRLDLATFHGLMGTGLRLLPLIVACVLVYGAAGLLLGVGEVHDMIRTLRRRLKI